MTIGELATIVDQYQSGIEAQLRLLQQLRGLAERQRDVTTARDFEAFNAESDARDRLTRSLVTIEDGLRPIRRVLVEHRSEAQRLPAFPKVAALHREASDMITHILSIDRESFRALADAEVARRAALSGLEQGEQTLAAYRKVLAPPVLGSSLVDKRG